MVVGIMVLSSCTNDAKTDKIVKTEELSIKQPPVDELSVDEPPVDKLSVCDNTKRNLQLFKGLMNENEIVYSDTLDKRMYGYANVSFFKNLFESKAIECITQCSDSNYFVFDILYNDSISAKDVLKTIVAKNNNIENINNNDYHTFFKRGLVLVLDETSNKIAMVVFNPFYDNNEVKVINNYFNSIANKYDEILIVIGFGNIKKVSHV